LLITAISLLVKNHSKQFIVECSDLYEVKEAEEILKNSPPIGFILEITLLPKVISTEDIKNSLMPSEKFNPVKLST